MAVGVGLVARLAFGLAFWVDKPLTHDEHEYLALAHSLQTGLGFRYPDPLPPALAHQQFSRAPGYPFFLSLIGEPRAPVAKLRQAPRAVKVAQAIVGAFGVFLVGLLAWRTAGPSAARIAAWIAAAYPPLVWIAGYVLTETMYSTLALMSVLLMTRALDERDTQGWRALVWLCACGMVAGLATLTHPTMLSFIALAAVWIGVRRGWQQLAALVLGSLLVISPWTVRNLDEHGRPVLVAASGGMNFWLGNHPLSSGDGDMAANPAVDEANLEFRRQHEGRTEAQLEPLYYREAARHIASDPLAWIGLLARKLFFLWIPVGPSYMRHSTLYILASVVSYGLLLPFAVAGALRFAGAGSAPVGLWLLAASTVMTSLVFFPQERFRIPLLDPALIVLAAAWLAERTRRVRWFDRRAAASAAPRG